MLAKLAMFAIAMPVLAVSIFDPRWPSLEIEFKARIEPEGAGTKELPGGVIMRPSRVYRVIQDAAHQIYFGYDVVLEASADGKSFQIRAEPLSASPEELQGMGLHPAWTKLSFPTRPVIPEIRVGATVKLDLLVSRASGQTIVDSITVRERGESKSAPRDFTVADAELHFPKFELRVNGSPIFTGSTGTTGAAVWFHAAEHGRFVFTLAPHPELGFTRIGTVAGTRVTITEGSTVYQLNSSETIASTTGTFYLYGRHDTNWTAPGGRFLLGSADRPEWIR